MMHQLKNGLLTVQEVHSLCSQRIKLIKPLNAYVNVTEEMSRVQSINSAEMFSKGKFTCNKKQIRAL